MSISMYVCVYGCMYVCIPSVKTNVGAIVVLVAAPTLWNSLPIGVKSVGNIATFRRKQKTHLFKLAYSS